MNNIKRKFIISLFLLTLMIFPKKEILADWWGRDTTRPILPREDVFPTDVTQPTAVPPTQVPVSVTSMPPVATATPRIGDPTGGVVNPSVTPTVTASSSSSDDPCAPGKSYTGPYCGWSPDPNTGANNNNSGGPSGGGTGQPRIGGVAVRGLSYTGGTDVAISDIIFLIGVLCLAMYAKSKAGSMKWS